MANLYQEHGFTDRQDYLESLCKEHDRGAVYALADLLGPEEDFDGLVSNLEDR